MKNKLYFILLLIPTLWLMQCSAVTEPTQNRSAWQTRNNGLPENATVTVITNVPNTTTLFIGTHNGVYQSTNNGELWREKNNGLESRDISCLAADDAHTNIVYAGVWGRGVFRSKNGGELWSSVWSADKNPHVNAIIVSSSDFAVYVATEQGLFKSDNAGESWNHIFNYGKIRTVAVHPNDPNTIYIGARWHGNLRSTDGGLTWHKINNGIYSDGQDVAAANRFIFDPQNSDHVYMSTGWIDLYHSSNGGESWTQIGQQLSERKVRALDINRSHPRHMWIVSETDGVLVSYDAGNVWSSFNEGLETTNIKSLFVMPYGDANVFVGTLGKGIYRYVDK